MSLQVVIPSRAVRRQHERRRLLDDHATAPRNERAEGDAIVERAHLDRELRAARGVTEANARAIALVLCARVNPAPLVCVVALICPDVDHPRALAEVHLANVEAKWRALDGCGAAE